MSASTTEYDEAKQNLKSLEKSYFENQFSTYKYIESYRNMTNYLYEKKSEVDQKWKDFIKDSFVAFFIPATIRLCVLSRLEKGTVFIVGKYITEVLKSDMISQYFDSMVKFKPADNIDSERFEDESKTCMLLTIHCSDVLDFLKTFGFFESWSDFFWKITFSADFKKLDNESDESFMDNVSFNLVKIRLKFFNFVSILYNKVFYIDKIRI